MLHGMLELIYGIEKGENAKQKTGIWHKTDMVITTLPLSQDCSENQIKPCR